MRAFVPAARLGVRYEPAGIRRAMDGPGAQTARRMVLPTELVDAQPSLAGGFLDHLVAAKAPEPTSAEMTEASAPAPRAGRG